MCCRSARWHRLDISLLALVMVPAWTNEKTDQSMSNGIRHLASGFSRCSLDVSGVYVSEYGVSLKVTQHNCTLVAEPPGREVGLIIGDHLTIAGESGKVADNKIEFSNGAVWVKQKSSPCAPQAPVSEAHVPPVSTTQLLRLPTQHAPASPCTTPTPAVHAAGLQHIFSEWMHRRFGKGLHHPPEGSSASPARPTAAGKISPLWWTLGAVAVADTAVLVGKAVETGMSVRGNSSTPHIKAQGSMRFMATQATETLPNSIVARQVPLSSVAKPGIPTARTFAIIGAIILVAVCSVLALAGMAIVVYRHSPCSLTIRPSHSSRAFSRMDSAESEFSEVSSLQTFSNLAESEFSEVSPSESSYADHGSHPTVKVGLMNDC